MEPGSLAVTRAWTENGYFTVPVFELISDDPDDRDYGSIELDFQLDDQVLVYIGGQQWTPWGTYVHVERVSTSGSDDEESGWVNLWDVIRLDEYNRTQFQS